MTSRNLTARLGAVERRRGRGPWRALVRWIEAVRPGEEGRRDEARRAAAAMRAVVQGEVEAEETDHACPIITTGATTDGEGIAEAVGRRWRFVLADDGAGGRVVGRLRRRVGRLGQRIPAPSCPVCREWGPIACLAASEDPLPWPAVCPICGRETTLVCIIGVDGEAL